MSKKKSSPAEGKTKRFAVRNFLRAMGDDMKEILGIEEAADPSSQNQSIVLDDDLPKELQEHEVAISSEQKEIDDLRLALEQNQKERLQWISDSQAYFEESERHFNTLLEYEEPSLEDEESEEDMEDSTFDDNSDSSGLPPDAPVKETEKRDTDVPPLAPYIFPTLDLLEAPNSSNTHLVAREELEKQKNLLQDALDSFSVDAVVINAIVGPRVTQFRVKPGVGVRVEAISGLEKNIALALSAQSIRIQAPIPGEPYVGIEAPNTNTLSFTLRGMLESNTWKNSDCEIPLVLGMDLNGEVILTDLNKAPHLLIAGATGSGKSVCMNNIIMSLLYHFHPEDLELILVDPKKVEFALYDSVPHLIHPVVTDPKVVVQALKWAVNEMDERYQKFSEKKVRNFAGYNQKAEIEGYKRMPYMVIIIDELADLMLTAKGDVEGCLVRLAQLSRAAGIHTIIATQRPSVNVITGVIKANFPTRVAFRVSSQIDSRTIIDTKGAESLMGQGDMLFNPPGIARLLRLQGPFVKDEDIQSVVEYLANQRPPNYRIELPEETEEGEDSVANFEDADPLLREALDIVVNNQRATTSFLQRRLKVGYNRAASLIEEMENRGYIGPQVGNNLREIYISAGEY